MDTFKSAESRFINFKHLVRLFDNILNVNSRVELFYSSIILKMYITYILVCTKIH